MSGIVSPDYWLVHALDWPLGRDTPRECARAHAPSVIERGSLAHDASRILDVADDVRAHSQLRVLFFSDLTQWLAANQTSWDAQGTDWRNGLGDLTSSFAISLALRLNRFQYTVMADARTRFTYNNRVVTVETREQVRAEVTEALERDWPSYIRSIPRR